MPVKLSTFLEAENRARISDVVAQRTGLSSVFGCYLEEGKPPYHLRMTLKVLFYACREGLMSCHQVWGALQYRADFAFLSAGQVLNSRTSG